MAAPTLLDYAESLYSDESTGSNIETTDDLDWNAAGDVIVVLGATEDQTITLATPTGTGLTLAALSGLPTATASSCKVYGWSATAAGNGNTVLTSTNTGQQARGISAWAFSGVSALGTPVVATNTAATVSMTVQADSSVVMVLADWNATADVTVTTEPVGGTIREATMVSGKASFVVVEWHNQAAGTRNYGVSAWTGIGTVSKAAVEVRGVTSSSTTASAESTAGIGATGNSTPGLSLISGLASAAAAIGDAAIAVLAAAGLAAGAAATDNSAVSTSFSSTAETAAATASGHDAAVITVVQAETATAVTAGYDAATVTAVAVQAETATAAAGAPTPAMDAGDPPVTESLFTSETPTLTNQSDGAPGITAAVTIRFTAAGEITHVRWYCTTNTGGTWTGKVWQVTTADEVGGAGTELASATFSGTPTGGAWNTIELPSPVTVTPNTALYKIGIHNDQGRYVATANFPAFVGGAGGVTSTSMHAPHNGDNPLGIGNVYQGSFLINASPGYPTLAGNAANYFADVVFAPVGAAPTQADAEVAAGGGEAPSAATLILSTADTAGGSAAAQNPAAGVTVQAETAAGTGAADDVGFSSGAQTANAQDATAAGAALDSATIMVVSAQTATVAAAAQDLAAAVLVAAEGTGAAGGAGQPVVDTGTPPVTESLFTSQVPTLTDLSDGTPGITVATTVRFSGAGQITHVRWYCTTNTGGTWTGKVWQVTTADSAGGTGTELASATFSGTPVPGWNTIALSSPVTVTPNTVLYKIGIHNDQGQYVATPNFTPFVGGEGGVISGHLHAPHHGDDPIGLGNVYQGSFLINAAPGYPTQSGAASNYFADMLFAPADVAATATPAGATGDAMDAGAAVTVTPDPAEAAGSALPAVFAGGATSALAEVAGAGGSAPFEVGTSISLTMISDAPVIADGLAYDATVGFGVLAMPAAATVAATANQPTTPVNGPVTVAAENAAASGASSNATIGVLLVTSTPTAAGAAYEPAVPTTGPLIVLPGTAGGAAAAFDPASGIGGLAGVAEATGDVPPVNLETGSQAELSAASELTIGTATVIRPGTAALSAASDMSAAGVAVTSGAVMLESGSQLTAAATVVVPPPYVASVHRIIKTQSVATVQRTDPVPTSIGSLV